MNRWWGFVLRTIGEDSPASAAQKVGVSPAMFTRWKQGAVPEAHTAVHLARVYGASPVQALVASGVLEIDEIGSESDGAMSLQNVPLETLVAEFKIRTRELELTFGELDVLRTVRNDRKLKGERRKRGLLR